MSDETSSRSGGDDEVAEILEGLPPPAGLRPPIPFVVPKFEDDDLRRKMRNNDEETQEVEVHPRLPVAPPTTVDNDAMPVATSRQQIIREEQESQCPHDVSGDVRGTNEDASGGPALPQPLLRQRPASPTMEEVASFSDAQQVIATSIPDDLIREVRESLGVRDDGRIARATQIMDASVRPALPKAADDDDVGAAPRQKRERPSLFDRIVPKTTFINFLPTFWGEGEDEDMSVGDSEHFSNNGTREDQSREEERSQSMVRGRRSSAFQRISNEMSNFQRRLSDGMSIFQSRFNTSGDFLVRSIWVEGDHSGIRETRHMGEVVMAEPVTFSERKWKIFVVVLCGLLVVLAVTLWVILMNDGDERSPTYEPSIQPSSPPSFDQMPTLEAVQTRGHVRCGLSHYSLNHELGDQFFLMELCRAVAAVLFGSPDKYLGVHVTNLNHFQQLNGRDVDLLLFVDAHTVQREVRESTTGAGFSFSSPYLYDGLTFYGNKTLVECAEDEKTYGDCSSLLVCVPRNSDGYRFVKSSFPSHFFIVGDSNSEALNMLVNGICNVLATDRYSMMVPHLSLELNTDKKYIMGTKAMTDVPLAIVTRNSDREFSDVINWVVHALFYGQERGLTKDSSLCKSYTKPISRATDLNFMNAVYCVGNYGDISVYGQDDSRMNHINNGTNGMLHHIPFGNMSGKDNYPGNTVTDTLLNDIREKQSLNCGVVVPDGYNGDIANGNGLVGMSVDYCRMLSAGLFDGNPDLVKLFALSESDESPFFALDNGSIDVLAGGRIEKKYDFASPPLLGGFHFSTPYYYGDEPASEDVSFFSLATRDEDDALFASFVNCIVLATIHAQKHEIGKTRSKEMPLASMFGSEFEWALRHAIHYGGSYDRLYEENFGDVAKEDRGRNSLSDSNSPRIHSFPGLSP